MLCVGESSTHLCFYNPSFVFPATSWTHQNTQRNTGRYWHRHTPPVGHERWSNGIYFCLSLFIVFVFFLRSIAFSLFLTDIDDPCPQLHRRREDLLLFYPFVVPTPGEDNEQGHDKCCYLDILQRTHPSTQSSTSPPWILTVCPTRSINRTEEWPV